MYVDNELPAADRKAVELFVQQNPDLQSEMEMLHQTVMKADDIVLEKKDWLYMQEDISAMQETLLLYADNELGPDESAAVEHMLDADDAVRAEWGILKQIKYEADRTVIFENKQALYRKEPARIIYITWRRAAAAAVLAGFGLWAGISVVNHKLDDTGTIAASRNTGNSQVKTETENNQVAIPATAQPNGKNDVTVLVTPTEMPAAQRGDIPPARATKAEVDINSTPANKDNVTTTGAGVNTGKNPKNPLLEKINSTGSNEILTANVETESKSNNRVSGNKVIVADAGTERINSAVNLISKNDNPAIIALQAASKNTESAATESQYLNIDNAKEKRTALSGFLRKAKRVLERTTNIKTGESVKVAGFEISL